MGHGLPHELFFLSSDSSNVFTHRKPGERAKGQSGSGGLAGSVLASVLTRLGGKWGYRKG